MLPSSSDRSSARAGNWIDLAASTRTPPGAPATAQQTLVERVELLEKTVESLRNLPIKVDRIDARLESVEGRLVSVEGRVGSLEVQIVQLRQEMGDGFSEMKALIREGDEATCAELRGEMRSLKEKARTEMRGLNAELRAEKRALNEETRTEMRGLNAETRRHMLVLHEDLVQRIATLRNGRSGSRRRGKGNS